MAYNRNIEVDKPPDTGESPSLGAQRIRYFKEAVIERLKNWIYGFLSDSETDEGLKKAPFKSQDTAPTQEATKIILYSKTVSGIPELFARDKNGVEIQITTNGKVNPAVIDHGGLIGLADDDHTAYYNSARHTKAIHDALAIDHGSLTGLGDDDHSQYLNNARHDVTARHPVSVLKFATGSFSEVITGGTTGTFFTTNEYGHPIQVKYSGGTAPYIFTPNPTYVYSVTTSWVVFKYIFKGNSAAGIETTVYAQWLYHSASKQAIWGIWDKEAKKLIAVLVEEDEGKQKLFPELKENQVLVKFKNPEDFLKEGQDNAGYILEHANVKEEDLEIIK